VNTVNLPHGRAQHAKSLEITHYARWVDSLLDKSRIAPRNYAALPFTRRLRTLVAVNAEQRHAAEELVRRRYAWRGYQAANNCGNGNAADERVTLLAENEGRLLGTVTVRPEAPLLAETTYGGEIERLRQGGHRVGELVQLAVEEGADWKAALDALGQSAYLVTRVIHALTDVVIEVNPRHVRFYRRVFGFMVAAAGRLCTRVGAPSVLMQLDLEQFARRVQSATA
jgi:N-acyl amino acid synthase FeeM